MHYTQWTIEKENQPVKHVVALNFNKGDIENYTDRFHDKMNELSAFDLNYIMNESGTSMLMFKSEDLNESLNKSVDMFKAYLSIINN